MNFRTSKGISCSVAVGCISILLLITATPTATASDQEPWRALVAAGQLVEVSKIDPSILVELRYATARNGTGTALYGPELPCLVRPEVAARLHLAQLFLKTQGAGLKIWDAYRPIEAQRALWKKLSDRRFVANPGKGAGSYHTQGLAVDVTLVDAAGKELPMPTDFDVFTKSASSFYHGPDKQITDNLRLLHYAMMRVGGFQGLTTEWWHFTVRDWKDYKLFSEGQ